MRHRPRQLPMPFDGDVPAVVLPAQTAHDLVNALADLLLATALDVHDDEERDDAREDHR
jgi:CTP-dependent riboflavin kinase